jgi:lipopolysaccharide/colanic/teichoic acid biosynthesis glycosyltransferase
LLPKRLFDLLASAWLLVLAAPIIFVVAIAVWTSSGGPVIYRQERVGRGGKTFNILKFRTMRSGGPPGSPVTATNDDRITRIGAVLRKWKLDELPQLINILRGEMSLIGPRPDVPAFVALYPADLRERVLAVPPGLTDPASIKYRNESELLARQSDPVQYYVDVIMPDKLALSAAYAASRSFWADIRIILATVRSVAGFKPRA